MKPARAAAPVAEGPPTNVEAGRALLGYYICTPTGDRQAREVLELAQELFPSPLQKRVLTALQRLARRSEPFHVELTLHELRKIDPGVSLAEFYALADPDTAAPTPAPFLRVLEDCRQRQVLHAVGGWLVSASADASQPVEELIDRTRRRLDQLAAVGR